MNNFIDLGIDFLSFIRYTIRIESERNKIMTEQERNEEQRKVVNRVQRWNDSVARVQALAAEWQREELERLPNKVLLHPVSEES